jgi:mannose-6-phosphate isomerase-like protein (cupin superfamily)
VSETAETITTPLTREECAAMARAIAADEANWRPHVKHDPGTRHYARIERNDDYEVYVICWMDDHDTGFHDHDVSAGGVHVVEGGIFEERLGFGTGHLERLVGSGETIEFAPSYIHRFRPQDGIPTVSVHVYSPPLRTMGAYHAGPDGALIRTPIDGETELVNLDA